jgi:hypothetical protein
MQKLNRFWREVVAQASCRICLASVTADIRQTQ